MIGVSILHFILWITGKLFPGPATGIASDDEEMEEWEGENYIEGGT